MRRLSPPRLALCLGVALLAPSLATAQGKGERVKFQTCDGVELHGTFYPGNGPKASCILLLHHVSHKNQPDGNNTQQDGWDRLATELSSKGNAVLSFDFRGHGNSLAVDPSIFWKTPHNAQLGGGGKGRETIEFKEFPKSYLPVLTNDICAAKTFLDRRNDEGQCNSNNIILIGAQDGAVLGAMWLAAEMNRYQIIQQLPLRLHRTPEGQAVKACIWLSMSQTFWQDLGNWLKVEAKSKRVPMVFVYGNDDPNAAPNFAKKWTDELNKSSDGSKTTKKVAFAESIKKTKLAGHQLLREDLPTVKRISDLLAEFGKNVTLDDYAKVEFEKKGYVWSFQNGSRVPAKQPDDKLLHPVPVANLR